MTIATPVPTRAAAPAAAWRVALALALAHAINDAYSGFLHPLLPRIMTELGLSIALAATLTSTLALAASLLQPVMGLAADRYGARRFLIAGPLVSAVFLSLIGLAPGFAALLALLAVGGLGSALFHPPAAAAAASAGRGAGSGARMSIFSFGGALGFAVAPLAAVALVGRLGLPGLTFAMIPALVLMPLIARVIPADARPHPVRPARLLPGRDALRGALGVLFVISALAAFVQRTFLTLQPIAIARVGGSEALGARVLSTYLVAQALGSLAGGFLVDRYDRRRVLFGVTFLSVPAHLLALALPAGSSAALAATAAAGLLNMALLPPLVVMAQEASPHGAATSAGIVMGLAWAAGSIVMVGAGALGDVIGARAAALAAVPVMLIASACALHPQLRPYRRPRAHAVAPTIPL